MKKNILFIEPLIPWPLTSGGHQAIYNGIKAIENDFNIFISYELYLESHEEDTATPELQKRFPEATLYPFIHRYKNPHPAKVFLWSCKEAVKKCLFYGKKKIPIEYGQQMLDHFKPADKYYIDFLNTIIKNNNIDIVQTEMVSRLSIGPSLSGEIKKIFVHHELRFVCHELEMINRNADSNEKIRFNKAKDLEINFLNQYDTVITLSETDKKKLKDAGVKTNIYSSTAIVNTQPNNQLHSNDYHTLTYVGPEFHTPNFLGIMWFLDNCWENLLSIDPEYKLKIIGKWNENTIKSITTQYKNVTFAGFVDDIRAEINDTIAIVPLTIGSGIRMKILEAATIGIPIVTTAVGVEGLPFTHNRSCMIADEPNDFVSNIIALQNKEKRERLIEQASLLVNERFSMSSLRNRLVEIILNQHNET